MPPDVAKPEIVVVVMRVYSQPAHGNIVVVLLHVATPISGVPAFNSAKIQSRNGTLFVVPRVAPDGTTMESADVTAAHVTVPVVNVVDRNGIMTGWVDEGDDEVSAANRLIVKALALADDERAILIGTSYP